MCLQAKVAPVPSESTTELCTESCKERESAILCKREDVNANLAIQAL